MDKIDLLLESSKTPEDFVSKLKKHVDSIHGDGSSNSIIDISNSEDEFISRMKKLGRATPHSKSKESQPLIDVKYLRDISTPDNIYKVAGDTMNILGKIPSTLLTPITETVRAPFKYIAENVGENTSQTPPVDTGAEFKQLGISDRAGLAPLITDISNSMGIRQDPLVDIKSQRYPKAAQFLKSMTTPANAGAMIIEGALAKSLPVPEVTTVGRASIDTVMNYLKSVSKDSKLFQELSQSGDIWNIAKMIQENPEYMRYNPENVIDKLTGRTNKEIGRRSYTDGDIGKTNIARGSIIEDATFDKGQVVDPRMLRDMAIGELSDPNILNTDAIPAERIIRNEIRTTEPSESTIRGIDDVNDAKFRLGDLENELNAERMMVENQASLEKNRIMNDVSDSYGQTQNPLYRDDLAWLSGLDVVNDPSGAGVFPKTRLDNTTKITSPDQSYTPIQPVSDKAGGVRRFEPSGKEIKIPGTESFVDSVSEINNPSNPINAVKSEKILDIAQGKQNQPRMIEDPAFSENLGLAIEKIGKINQALKNIGERKVPGISNEKYLQLIDEKRRLEGFVYNNDNPNLPDQRAYSDYLDTQNQMSLNDAVRIRKKGNSMYNPTQMRVDQAPMSLAGESIVKSVDEILRYALTPDEASQYSSLGRDMKNKINYNDLISGNLRPKSASPIDAGDLTYKAGIVRSALGDPWDRGVRPVGERLLNRTKGIGNNILMQNPGKIATTSAVGINEIMPDKNAIAEFKIPRTVEGIIENAPMVIRKIGTMFGPEAVKAFQQAKSSEEISALMGQFSVMNPESFELDPYGRFDGQITNPLLKQKAMESIINNSTSPVESAKQMQLLMKGGKYYGN